MALGIKHLQTAGLAISLALAAPAWAAEVYRWVDDDGNVHYGDAEPLGREAEKVDLEAEEPLTDDPLYSAPVRTAPAKTAPAPAGRQPIAFGQVDEDACRRARSDVAVLAGDAPVYLTAGGEYRAGSSSQSDGDRLGWLSSGQRSAYLAMARQRAERFCADPELAATRRGAD